MATDENDRRLAAPGELELVRDFVNTRDLGKRTDRIDAPEALSSWLAGRSFVPDPPGVTEDDVTRVRSLREALRAMLLANAGFPLDPKAVDAFNDAARAARLGVRAGDDGRVALFPAGEGPDRAISRLLSAVFAAQESGTWPRLKACAECHWALYDRTKNRSAAWCDPAKCGARARSRRYRERRRGTPAYSEARKP
jgi:predicted RNA-binding Zn ribbon-like protein